MVLAFTILSPETGGTPDPNEPKQTHFILYDDGRMDLSFEYADAASNKKVTLSAIQMKIIWMGYNTIGEIANGRRDFTESIGNTDTPQPPRTGGTTKLGE